MRNLIVIATTATLLAASLPVWACGMPPMETMTLTDAMAQIDLALEEPVTPATPVELTEIVPEAITPEAPVKPVVPTLPTAPPVSVDPQS
jgi:hypothetical protein